MMSKQFYMINKAVLPNSPGVSLPSHFQYRVIPRRVLVYIVSFSQVSLVNRYLYSAVVEMGCPGGSVVKNPSDNTAHVGSVPELG